MNNRQVHDRSTNFAYPVKKPTNIYDEETKKATHDKLTIENDIIKMEGCTIFTVHSDLSAPIPYKKESVEKE